MEKIFDYYFQAYRELQGACPGLPFYGSQIGRVKEVAMIKRDK